MRYAERHWKESEDDSCGGYRTEKQLSTYTMISVAMDPAVPGELLAMASTRSLMVFVDPL